jgi:CRP-like cAMP-binding protein
LVTGSCGYVLPRIQNRVYLELKQGAYFGHSELASNKKFMDLTNFKSLSGIIMRNFTVQSFENSELLSLNMGDLFKMKLEF